MGFFRGLGEFLFEVLESSAKSTAQHRYDTARKYSRDTSLSEEQRKKAAQIAESSKKTMDGLKATQAKRDELKEKLFNK